MERFRNDADPIILGWFNRVSRAWCLVDSQLKQRSSRSSAWDFISGRRRYSDSILADWIFDQKQAHPLLSCFAAHEYNPFSRTERQAVLACQLALAFVLTIFEYTIPWDTFRWIFSSVVAPVLLYIWEAFLRCIATCSCFQREKTPDPLRSGAMRVGRLIVRLGLILSLSSAILCSIFFRTYISSDGFLLLWTKKIVVNWVLAVPTDSVWFLWARSREKERAQVFV